MLGVLRHRPRPDAVRRDRPSGEGLFRRARPGGRVIARVGEGERMSASVDQSPQGSPALRLHRQLAAIWGTGPGLQRLAAVNHSIIGRRFMATAFVFFAIGGVLGMLTRVQLATPMAAFMDPETYNQVFTMHGSIMLFLFAIGMANRNSIIEPRTSCAAATRALLSSSGAKTRCGAR